MLDVDERIEQSGCADTYKLVQDCIDKYNRDWRKCQDELKNLSNCLHKNS